MNLGEYYKWFGTRQDLISLKSIKQVFGFPEIVHRSTNIVQW